MEKKNNVVLVLLFIIIGVMACFGIKMSKEIVELKQNNQNVNSSNENKQQDDSQVNDKASESNENVNNIKNNDNVERDITLDNNLKENINILLQSSMDKYLINDLFKNDLLNNISEDEKMSLILRYSFNRDTYYSTNEYKDIGLSSNGKKEYKTMISYNPDKIYYTSSDTIKKLYYQLFGNDFPINNKDYKDNGNGIYLYDSVNNSYILDFISGTSFEGRLNYVYKYTTNSKLYYVYVAVGNALPANDDVNIYKGNNTNQLYKKISNDEYRSFKINANNYQDFEHFRFSFEKNNDGNYIFKTIERIK